MIHNKFDKEKQEMIIDRNTKKVKGISKAVVENNRTHGDYKNVLETNIPKNKKGNNINKIIQTSDLHNKRR